MQFTATIIAAFAATALAAPNVARWGGSNPPTGQCNAGTQSCCTGAIGAIELDCLIQVLGTTCDASSYCCDTNAPVGTYSLVNINALNCVNL